MSIFLFLLYLNQSFLEFAMLALTYMRRVNIPYLRCIRSLDNLFITLLYRTLRFSFNRSGLDEQAGMCVLWVFVWRRVSVNISSCRGCRPRSAATTESTGEGRKIYLQKWRRKERRKNSVDFMFLKRLYFSKQLD